MMEDLLVVTKMMKMEPTSSWLKNQKIRGTHLRMIMQITPTGNMFLEVIVKVKKKMKKELILKENL